MSSAPRLCGVCRSAAGGCCCTCTVPPTPICSSCTIVHIASAGTHVIESLPATVLNDFCSHCMSEPSESVCCCNVTGVLLCHKCVSIHNAKFPDKMHIILPVRAKNFVGTSGYFERLTKRQAALQGSLGELRANLELVDRCEVSLIQRAEKLMQEVQQYQKAALKQLSEYKAQLEWGIAQAQAEVELHIYEDAYVPTGAIAKVIWNYSPGKLSLFSFQESGSYKVDISAKLAPEEKVEEQKMAKAPLTEAPAQPIQVATTAAAQLKSSQAALGLQPIFVLTQTSLMIFNHAGGRKELADRKDCYASLSERSAGGTLGKQVALQPQNCVFPLSSAAVLSTGKILVSGSSNPWSAAAYIIDPVTGQLSRAREMHLKREGHALVSYLDSVFAFGGNSPSGITAASEVYSEQSNSWTSIRNMSTARSYFNPCVSGHCVYIFGGLNTVNCELYSIPKNVYSKLGVTVPRPGQTAAALTQNGQIFVVQSKWSACWTVGSGGFSKASKTGAKENCWGNLNPVVIGSKMFIPLFYTCSVDQINIK